MVTPVVCAELHGSGKFGSKIVLNPILSFAVQTSGAHNITTTRVVEINRQPIELFKILKFEGLVGTGGEAKMVIQDGQVRLNGKVETQKSKKILSGDVIEFREDTLNILLKEQPLESDVTT